MGRICPLFFVLLGGMMISRLKIKARRLVRPIRFGLVGLSGVVVNSTVLWLLVHQAHLVTPLASVIATETAILSNFALNDRWTFHAAAHQRSFGQRLLRFNGVALGGLAITTGALTALTSSTHLHLLLANLLAVGTAMSWNYLLNSRWTWNLKVGPSHVRPELSEKPSPGERTAAQEAGATQIEPADARTMSQDSVRQWRGSSGDRPSFDYAQGKLAVCDLQSGQEAPA